MIYNKIVKTAQTGTTKLNRQKVIFDHHSDYVPIRKVCNDGGVMFDGNRKLFCNENIFLTGNVIDTSPDGRTKLVEVIAGDGHPGWLWLEAKRDVTLISEWFEPISNEL